MAEQQNDQVTSGIVYDKERKRVYKDGEVALPPPDDAPRIRYDPVTRRVWKE